MTSLTELNKAPSSREARNLAIVHYFVWYSDYCGFLIILYARA